MNRVFMTLALLVVFAASAFAGTITGIVTDTDGEAVDSAQVWITQCDDEDRERHRRRHRHHRPDLDLVFTNENGEYLIEDLEEGTYMVHARARGEGGARLEVEVPTDGNVQADLVLPGCPDDGDRRRHHRRWRHRPNDG